MPEPGDVDPEIYEAVRDDVKASRKETAFNLEAASDADPEANEPLMTAIDSARQRRAQAETEIRRLIAYGREFARPRPYRAGRLRAQGEPVERSGPPPHDDRSQPGRGLPQQIAARARLRLHHRQGDGDRPEEPGIPVVAARSGAIVHADGPGELAQAAVRTHGLPRLRVLLRLAEFETSGARTLPLACRFGTSFKAIGRLLDTPDSLAVGPASRRTPPCGAEAAS